MKPSLGVSNLGSVTSYWSSGGNKMTHIRGFTAAELKKNKTKKQNNTHMDEKFSRMQKILSAVFIFSFRIRRILDMS